jgi:DNA-binding NarL/FixJ family response regulator
MTTPLLTEPTSDPHVENLEPVFRVVVIDPREERRAITILFVERCTPLIVVGLAASLDEAETQIRSERADIALVEIQMPVEKGLDTIRALRTQFPDLRIVVCSFHYDSATRDATRLCGADGYLMKPFQCEDLVDVALHPQRIG